MAAMVTVTIAPKAGACAQRVYGCSYTIPCRSGLHGFLEFLPNDFTQRVFQ